MVIQGLFNYANAYNGSLSLTSTSGAYATFNFAGIKVRVYGTVDPGLPPSGSTYSIAKPPSFHR
ncbi:hypothetical protein AcW1_004942 [Taiwanofungus camphoratus]|nr:hypothetical protein AcW2_006047 [Antrodia cinnamomea]KAI0941313.1 hypothetical protein AcV7_002918 [Antrodia cinnamomea]KAI0960423.1 hypothetical protein AcW1_004942 [Antrodia cinnamomea]